MQYKTRQNKPTLNNTKARQRKQIQGKTTQDKFRGKCSEINDYNTIQDKTFQDNIRQYEAR